MMALHLSPFQNSRLSIAIVIVAIAVILQLKFDFNFITFFSSFKIFNLSKTLPKLKQSVYYTQDLSQYNGIVKNKLYLAVLGTIYDVSAGSKHYGKGGSYHYFIGKDGSRALITGDFKDESTAKDHVLDLSCDSLFTLVQWKDTYKQKYIYKGVLNGRFYDENGQETEYMKEFLKKLEICEVEKEKARQEEIMFPPCNMAWSIDEGTKVWCTKSSGGITRSWVGVPRQLFTPGKEKPICVCINQSVNNNLALIKEYAGCPQQSTTCVIEND